jgi:phenylalanyl-tRNA synthetase beta chain
MAGRVPQGQELSKFPAVRRDIAVILPDAVAWAAVEAALRGALGAALQELFVFDQYQGASLGTGVKSLAIGLILQDSYRTLTDQDADAFVANAVAALERECQARLRG